MKRVGFLKEKIVSLNNLYLAYNKVCRGKRGSSVIAEFAKDFDNNICALKLSLENNSVEIGQYHYFTIFDPKKRVICAASFVERIVHHAIMNVCHTFFDKRLVYSTYATRPHKGQYKALERAKTSMRKYAYSVKLDYRKYFDSISHDVLKRQLRRMFKDLWLLQLFDKIIDSYCVKQGFGIPIGNLTSQYFANMYLSELDHMLKEKYKVLEYIRYMDDILIFDNCKEKLKQIVGIISEYSKKELSLSLKTPLFRKRTEGQVFLGYRVYANVCSLSSRSKRRFRTKFLKYSKLLKKGVWTQSEYQVHIIPLLAFVKHSNSSAFVRSCIDIEDKR